MQKRAFQRSIVFLLCPLLLAPGFAIAKPTEKVANAPEATIVETVIHPDLVVKTIEHTDPPALLVGGQVEAMADLARRLSTQRDWLGTGNIELFAEKSLSIDELFAEAPELIAVGDGLYRPKLDLMGDLWAAFDPEKDSFIVYLTHEIYDGAGEDLALGYVDGNEILVSESDLKARPALALTLNFIPDYDRPLYKKSVLELGDEIPLGEAFAEAQIKVIDTTSPLERQSGWTTAQPGHKSCETGISCSGGSLSCSGGYQPFFEVTRIRIKTDHEGWLAGKPEVELFPLDVQFGTPPGGNPAITTSWIFDGRWITDMAGDRRYLPDINNEDQWYRINDGAAVFDLNLSPALAAMLVEDDRFTGQLFVDGQEITPLRLALTATSIVSVIVNFNVLSLIPTVLNFVDLIADGLRPDDDFFANAIGVQNFLSNCGNSVNMTFTSPEWDMQGQVRCIDPSCTPPPDPPSCGTTGSECTWQGDCCAGYTCMLDNNDLGICIP